MTLFGKPQQVVVFAPELVELGEFGTGRTGFPADGLILDVSLSERHATEAEPTRYPVESGGFISDHVQRPPRRLDGQAFITDTPAGLVEAATEAARNLQTSINQTLGEPVEGPLATTRSKDLYALLQIVAENDVLCRVVTDLEVYDNMVMTRLSVPRTPADGRGLTVDFAFQRITVARTTEGRAITIEEPTPSTNPAPKATTKMGQVTPKTAPSTFLGRTSIAR